MVLLKKSNGLLYRMNKFFTLLTLSSLISITTATEEEFIPPTPTATWTNNQNGGGNWDADKSTVVSSDGNWTMRVSLNAEALMNTFKPSTPTTTNNAHVQINDNSVWKDEDGRYVASDTLGKGLFSLTGDTYQKRGGEERQAYTSQTTTFVMGWGNDWFASRGNDGSVVDESYNVLGTTISAGNGMAQGLQLGFSHEPTPNEKEYKSEDRWLFGGIKGDVVTLEGGNTVGLNGYREGYDMGSSSIIDALANRTFEVYRADTKVQQEGADWTISETGEGAARVDTLDAIVSGASISTADLVIVHTTSGDIASTVSFTTLYLTVTLTDGTLLRYMAEINDESTFSTSDTLVGEFADKGEALSGSSYYDIDNLTLEGISNINHGLIDFIEVYDQSHMVSKQGQVMPEPTTATLSLMALAALAARRRRR